MMKNAALAALGLEMRLQPGDIAPDERHEIGRHGCGRGALILSKGRQNLARQHDGKLGIAALQKVVHPPFVVGIAIGVQQANGHRLRALALHQVLHRGKEVPFVEGHDNLAARADPFGDFHRHVQRDDGRGLFAGECIDVGSQLALQHQQVPEAARDKQHGAAALALDHGIGGHGGAVAQLRDTGGALSRRILEALDDAARGVAGGRGDLVGADMPVGIGPDEIGEGAADLDSYSRHCQIVHQ
jgi:hypothetical protein